MRTPVKMTRDSHSEQCVSRKKTSAREARGEAQGLTVLMRYRMRGMLLRNDTTYFVVLTSVQ